MNIKPVIFSVVLSGTLWLTTPLRARYLDPHIVGWSERLLGRPGQWPKRIAWLLRRIGVPATQLAYLFVVILIVARLTFPSVEPLSSPEVIRQQLGMTAWVALHNVALGKSDVLAWPPKGSKIDAALTALDVEATQGFLEWVRQARKDEYIRASATTLGELKVLGLVKNIRVGQDGMPSAEITRIGRRVVEPYLE